ncbi:MAG TPA: hypothetical protein VEU96_15390, partial [Bryobacteraceae bacterium]|nr:hypothetical protein [Bryobacteraceae bacterium]
MRKINPSGVISTYAGTGVPGYSGDRGKATLAQLSGPIGLAVDGSGNLYIADRDNFRVRRITLDGTINTVAGNGRSGSGGDNGPATSAPVAPLALALDGQGNLYISTFDFRIRKVDAKGIITTIAGTGTLANFGDNGPATQAAIGLVVQMAADTSGNVYLADFLNFRIRKIDSAGMMTTVAGSGTSGFIFDGAQATMSVLIPDGVALDGSGNLYLSDINRDVIRKVALSAGTITTIAGNGSNGYSGDNDAATRAALNTPEDLTVDSTGQIYVADFGNKRVRKISSGVISTIAGTSNGDGGPAISAFLNAPAGLAVDGVNNVAFADVGNSVVRR